MIDAINNAHGLDEHPLTVREVLRKMEAGKVILAEGTRAKGEAALAKAASEVVKQAGRACKGAVAGIVANASNMAPKELASILGRTESTIRGDRLKVRRGDFGIYGSLTKEKRELYVYRLMFRQADEGGNVEPVDSHTHRQEMWSEGLENLLKGNKNEQTLTGTITFMDNSMVSCKQLIPGLKGVDLPRELQVAERRFVTVVGVKVRPQAPRKNISYEEQVCVYVCMLYVCM